MSRSSDTNDLLRQEAEKDLARARNRDRHQRTIRQGLGTEGREGSIECTCGDVYGAWRAHCPSCGSKPTGRGAKKGAKKVS